MAYIWRTWTSYGMFIAYWDWGQEFSCVLRKANYNVVSSCLVQHFHKYLLFLSCISPAAAIPCCNCKVEYITIITPHWHPPAPEQGTASDLSGPLSLSNFFNLPIFWHPRHQLSKFLAPKTSKTERMLAP